MKKISYLFIAFVISILITTIVYSNNYLNAQESESCRTMRVKLGSETVFCIKESGILNRNESTYTPQDRADIVEKQLDKIANNFAYNLESIQLSPNTSDKQIVIDKPGTENEIESIITLLPGDTNKNNQSLQSLNSESLKEIVQSAVEDYRRDKYNSQYIVVKILDNFDNKPTVTNGIDLSNVLDVITKIVNIIYSIIPLALTLILIVLLFLPEDIIKKFKKRFISFQII